MARVRWPITRFGERHSCRITCDSRETVPLTLALLFLSQGDPEGSVTYAANCGRDAGTIVAKKFKRVRAALCTNSYMGRMTSAHNRSNVLCLGGQVIGKLHALDIVDDWLQTEYWAGRHDISLGLMDEIEGDLCTDALWRDDEDA